MASCSLIVKATRLCNLRCTYCHDWRDGPGQIMPFAVLARMTAAALRDPAHDAVTFIWHGGEPSMLPFSFFQRAMAVQARFARPGQAVANVMQTNGTRITPDLARFLKQHRFGVGVSIDGPPELHDRHRRHASGRGSFNDVAVGLHILEDHGIPFSVLMVVDEATLDIGPAAIFDFFVERGIKRFGFNAVCPDNQADASPGTPADNYVAPAAMAGFLGGVFDRWRAHGDPEVHVRELDAIVARLHGAPSRLCHFQGGCLGSFFVVEPDGRVGHCDLFLGDPAYWLGNVLVDDFAALRASPAMAALSRRRQEEVDAMASCPDFVVCNGWCPHEKYLSSRHDSADRAGCCGLDGLIEHIRRALPEPGKASFSLPLPMVRSKS